ncbi:helix-turn-helix domain-containing protein [Abiotrophia defectiva]|jgi:DNA-binding helix-turn-helix protein|uniref:helix-turn-helix domain-containing protein n=1 Tax=Abiotrophia defectiva TaxID=46125 RepID=UPI00206E9536|nr:helix-turn-helix transcriptional regulator [Abiotrophia defectiva]DAF12391.1 MAG TPA: helix-turn-helix domain protein [Caudoviricetes sp.]DAT01721.1 MAG TPA: helix-turn-helix domain protein [Caudoviricetes sp.]DAX60495.1 MAG TPA: helix-turn-helix domain protein [Caudoviricetes sp.]
MKQLSIKAVRINCGMTQQDLANKLGITAKSISDLENGRVPIKPLHIFAIAYACNIDADKIRI